MRTKRILLALLAFVLLAAACGGDDGGTDESTSDDPSGEEGDGDGGEGGDGEFTAPVDDCEDPDAATAPIEGDITLGSSIPQSGGPAVLFAPWGDGMQAYFDFYNETEGGVGGTQQINLVMKDDQYVDTQTVANVTEIIDNDDPDAFVGVIGTPNNLAVREDLNALCIPQLLNGTGAPEWGDIENFPWTMGGLVPYSIESRAFAEFAAGELPDGGTAGVFYVNTEFGEAYVEPFEEAASEAGFEVVAEETIAAEDSGAPSSQMTNLVAADPDIILAVPLGAQCISFMQELGNAKAQNADFDPIVYVTGTCASSIFFGAAGESANGVYSSINIVDTSSEEAIAASPAATTFAEQLASVNPDADPGGIAPAGWTVAETMVHILEEAAASPDGLTQASIIEAARSIDGFAPSLIREGLSVNTSATDGYPSEGTQIIVWNDGGFEDVGGVTDFDGTTTYEG